MSTALSLSRLTLGVAATATSASGAIVVFDIPDTTYDSVDSLGELSFSAINLQSATYSPSFSGSIPKFRIGSITGYLTFFGEGMGSSTPSLAGDILDSGLNFPGGYVSFYDYDLPTGSVYLPLLLISGQDAYFGWFEFNSTVINMDNRNFTFTRFAFNDVAGQAILAGQTSAIPEPSTLGLVGGLFGLVAAAHLRRRKLKQVAASEKFMALAAGEKLN